MRIIWEAMQWILHQVKKLFITGIFTILPLAVTILSIRFIYGLTHYYIAPLGLPILGSITIGILLLGILGKFIFTRAVVHPIERLIHKIPFFGAIYSGVKTLVDFFNVSSHPEHKRTVVLVPYPSEKYYSMAILVGSADKDFQRLIPENTLQQDDTLVKVFIPTTHITLGSFFLIPKSLVIETDIKFEEAIKTILSCGIIVPASLRKHKIKKSDPTKYTQP